jgi:hypothetical protein
MNWNDVITTLLTSTAVSAIVSFVLKTFFETRLKHHFEKELENLRQTHTLELEKIKSSLTIVTDAAHQLLERRLTTYPRLVELVYRTRNLAREIVNAIQPMSTLSDEFAARTRELEEQLYASRMDLERDGVFGFVHSYKNTIVSFHRLDRDLRHFLDKGDTEEANKVLAEMKELYSQIESEYKTAVNSLSSLSITSLPQ